MPQEEGQHRLQHDGPVRAAVLPNLFLHGRQQQSRQDGGIQPPKGFVQTEQAFRHDSHQSSGHLFRFGRDDALPTKQTVRRVRPACVVYAKVLDGIKEHLDTHPIGGNADKGRDAGNARVFDGSLADLVPEEPQAGRTKCGSILLFVGEGGRPSTTPHRRPRYHPAAAAAARRKEAIREHLCLVRLSLSLGFLDANSGTMPQMLKLRSSRPSSALFDLRSFSLRLKNEDDVLSISVFIFRNEAFPFSFSHNDALQSDDVFARLPLSFRPDMGRSDILQNKIDSCWEVGFEEAGKKPPLLPDDLEKQGSAALVACVVKFCCCEVDCIRTVRSSLLHFLPYSLLYADSPCLYDDDREALVLWFSRGRAPLWERRGVRVAASSCGPQPCLGSFSSGGGGDSLLGSTGSTKTSTTHGAFTRGTSKTRLAVSLTSSSSSSPEHPTATGPGTIATSSTQIGAGSVASSEVYLDEVAFYGGGGGGANETLFGSIAAPLGLEPSSAETNDFLRMEQTRTIPALEEIIASSSSTLSDQLQPTTSSSTTTTTTMTLWQGRLLVVACAAICGTNYPLIKMLDASIPSAAATAIRFVLAAVAVGAGVWAQERRSDGATAAATAATTTTTESWQITNTQKAARGPATLLGAEVGVYYGIAYIAQANGLHSVDASKVRRTS